MADRRLVGIDLGIASAHTVRVIDQAGETIAKRKCWPSVDSLGEVERCALGGAEEGTRLEVIMEPTGPAWLPIAVFFASRGHAVFRVSSAKASDLRKFFSRHTKTNGIDADTLARTGIVERAGMVELRLPDAARATLDRRVRAADRLTAQDGEHKVRIKDLVRQVVAMSPLTGDLGAADLGAADRALLEAYGDPNLLVKARAKRLSSILARASQGHQGAARAEQWITAAEASLECYAGHPAVAFVDLAAKIATEVRLLRAITAELAAHATATETAYKAVDPDGLARSLPGLADIGGPAIVANLPERAWTVMRRAEPYVIRDTDGRAVTPAEAKAIIDEQWTVPADVRARRRSKKAGKTPSNVLPRQSRPQRGQRGDRPLTPSSTLAS